MKRLTDIMMAEAQLNEYYAQTLNKKLTVGDKIVSGRISERDLRDAGWGASFLDDASWIVVDGREYRKIKRDAWQASNGNMHVLSGTVTSAQLFKEMKKNPQTEWPGEMYLSDPKKVIL